ncbi:MAG: hypothetical protein K8T25_03255 [Planctomycetia bacterium]|nr:hypothetical protein [Planctomycetia bacterium]
MLQFRESLLRRAWPLACCALLSAVVCVTWPAAGLTDEPAGAGPPKTGRHKLAPGVETTVPMSRSDAEVIDPHHVIELKSVPNLEWTPNHSPQTGTLSAKSTDTLFRRGVWQFQFSFKPLRMIWVDMPQADGKMQRKLVWYMVYRVTNPGQHITPIQGAESKEEAYEAWHKGLYTVERVDLPGQMLANIGPHRFMPLFTIRSAQEKIDKEWLDRLVPLAKEAIYRREQPPCKLEEFYNTVQIAQKPIPVSNGRADNSVYGYVTWLCGDPARPAVANEIDPKLKFFSIDIWGLTNAYKWADVPGAYKAGDPPGTGRKFVTKVLQINYSHLGDEYQQHDDELHLGIAGQVDWEWIYR